MKKIFSRVNHIFYTSIRQSIFDKPVAKAHDQSTNLNRCVGFHFNFLLRTLTECLMTSLNYKTLTYPSMEMLEPQLELIKMCKGQIGSDKCPINFAMIAQIKRQTKWVQINQQKC